MAITTSAFTHGMEIEQFPDLVGDDVRDTVMSNNHGSLRDWHHDPSGPRETAIGPYKHAGRILSAFMKETADAGRTWEWHSADGEDGRASGAGSHVHLCIADDGVDDPIEAWTIAYNSVVETLPFLAPFFCHNWELGFRNGTTHYTGELSIEHWADPQLTRYRPETIRSYVESPSSSHRRFKSVTFNPAVGSKPVTFEIRQNDAHPVSALTGLVHLRRMVTRCIHRGYSVKLENHETTLTRVYDKIYRRASEVGLLTAMQEPIQGGIRFQEGRGIPTSDGGELELEYESAWDVLQAIINTNGLAGDSWDYRVTKLVKTGNDAYGPQNNAEQIWNVKAPAGEFFWAHEEPGAGIDPEDADGSDTAVSQEGI